ncbi:molybdopterin-guanine dinucleotide biosynthesis protein MobA [Planctomycetes bacterium Pla86]|uniref:Molybdopterin-guanine dinucleotide biosynthesis protein MobA n=2 Tax=Engelhardtia mirabilis TaxID=2528011 RepID=A0A518BJM0_9BACT|nr:molybdopterin-guanine dinucleotide biosynthesis protein MobA [Planctomycetes bacterium Pla133]QDV01508.1 molybdopterin-guanine dinucleotide biosynthesis protein MobA [Planctomycetes bacterium Pla86]
MGTDKARLRWEGSTLLARAVEALRPLCDRVLLASGERARYGDLGLDASEVLDRRASFGPLAGIEAALLAASGEWLVTTPVDMPGTGAAVFGALIDRARSSGADAVTLRSPRGIEPLVAVYRVSVCAPLAQRLLDEGQRRPVALAAALCAVEIDVAEFGEDVQSLLRNVNAPNDLFTPARGRADDDLTTGGAA